MSVISGVAGAVEKDAADVHAVGRWTVNHSADVQSFVASGTDGAEVTIAGNNDWSGSYEAYGDTPAVKPGEGFVFHGSFDGTSGCYGTCIVDEVVIECDIEGGAPIKHTVSFSSNGALTIGAEEAADADMTTEPLSAIGRAVQVSGVLAAPDWNTVEDVRSWTLTLRSNNPSYVSSTSAGETKRVAGAWSAELSISVYTEDASDADDFPQVNEVKLVRLYTTGAYYWDIFAMIFGELGDMGADIEGQGPVEATLNAKWTGYADEELTWTKGHIKTPAAAPVTWWPPA